MGKEGRDQADDLKWRKRKHSLGWAPERENRGAIVHSLGR